MQVSFAIGEISLALLAYLIQQWKNLQITLSVLVFSTVVTLLIIPESPRWLIATNKLDEAIKVLETGAKINNKSLPEISKITKPKEKESAGIGAILTNKFAVQITCVMSINWMVTTLCYFGLSLNAVNLTGTNPYINFVLSGVIEIISYMLTVLLIDRMGRKTLLVFCQLLAGGTCLAAGLINNDMTTLIAILTLAGKELDFH